MMRGGSHLYSLSRNQSLVILVLFKHAQSLCSRGRYVNCPGPSCHPRESTKLSQLLEGVRGGRWWDGDWSIQKAREMDDVHPLRAQSTPFLFPSMHLDISLSLSSSWCFEDTSWFILLSRPSSEPQYFFIFFIFFFAERHNAQQDRLAEDANTPWWDLGAKQGCVLQFSTSAATVSAGWDAPSLTWQWPSATKSTLWFMSWGGKRLWAIVFSLFI